MYLKQLGLERFRCYEKVDIELGPGLHVFVGPNAGGKTSVLEAIYLLAATKSHRTSADRELIAWEADWARVTGVFATHTRGDLTLRTTLRTTASQSPGASVPRKTVEVNSVPRKRFTEIIGQAEVVMFGPDDLALVKGAPSLRRRFLNAGISQVRPMYLDDLMRFRRGVRQRNECLKRCTQDSEAHAMLSAWDVQVAQSAAAVAGARLAFINALHPHARHVHATLTDHGEQIEIAYSSDLSEPITQAEREAHMRALLRDGVERDIYLGRTMKGPHRDDIQIKVDGKSLRDFGSQGQQRTAALSLTLGQAALFQEWGNERPIVLLDDCLSELDESRARKVLELTRDVEQVIVTTASWDRLLEEYAEDARVLDVGAGQVRERGG